MRCHPYGIVSLLAVVMVSPYFISMQVFPRLRTDLVSSKATVDGAVVYTVKDPITGGYFRLREPEYWLVNQFDGSSSPQQLAERFREKFNLNISEADVGQFIDTTEQLFFLDDGRAEQQLSRTSYRGFEKRSMADKILYVKLGSMNPGRFLDWLTRVYSHFHNRFFFFLEAVVILIGLLLLVGNASQFRVSLYDIFSIGSIITIVLAFFIFVMLHEFAHAVMCRYHGGEVREIGFLLIYFSPAFYADLSDAWLFEKKSQRLAVTWAGPYCQFVLLALAIIVWRITLPGTFVNEVAQLTVIVCWITFLFNFNPLIKLDGYYLLSDWLDIPNLRKKAMAYLNNAFKRRVLGWPIDAIEASRRHARIFLIYSVLAVLYSTILLGYIFVVVATFLTGRYGGFGLILLFAVLLFMLRRTIADLGTGIIKHLVYMKNLFKHPVRLAVYIIVLAAVLVFCFVVPFPHHVSGEVTVGPLASFTLTLNDAGLLESKLYRGGESPENKASLIQLTATDMAVLDIVPMVKDGQAVVVGDTLAILTSSQVTHEVIAARAELQRLEGQLSLLKAPPKREEIAEAEAEVRSARATLDQVTRDLRRHEELAEKNLIAAEQLESQQSSYEIALAELSNKESALQLLKSPPRPEEEDVLKSEIDKQRARLDFLRRQAEAQQIVAPFAGVVSARQNDKHILTLLQNRQSEIFVPVSDFEITLVKAGQQVRVKVRSFPHLTFFGAVVRIPRGTVDGENRFPVSVVIDNSHDLLHKGMTGYAKIDVGQASLATLAYRKLLSNVRVEFWSWW